MAGWYRSDPLPTGTAPKGIATRPSAKKKDRGPHVKGAESQGSIAQHGYLAHEKVAI